MLSKIAQRLLKSNKELKAIVLENEKSYKLLEAKITPRLLATIGKAEGVFIKRNELIWAIIDEASGTSKGGELKYQRTQALSLFLYTQSRENSLFTPLHFVHSLSLLYSDIIACQLEATVYINVQETTNGLFSSASRSSDALVLQ